MSPEEERAHRIADANHRADLARYEADIQTSLEATKTANKFASDALRAVTLLNGGAAVAILAFIGHLASKGDQSALMSLKHALFIFVAGTFFSVFASVLAYFVQEEWVAVLKYKYRKRDLEAATPQDGEKIRAAGKWGTIRRRLGWTLKVAAILCGISALVSFWFGSYTAYRAFEQLSAERPDIARQGTAGSAVNLIGGQRREQTVNFVIRLVVTHADRVLHQI